LADVNSHALLQVGNVNAKGSSAIVEPPPPGAERLESGPQLAVCSRAGSPRPIVRTGDGVEPIEVERGTLLTMIAPGAHAASAMVPSVAHGALIGRVPLRMRHGRVGQEAAVDQRRDVGDAAGPIRITSVLPAGQRASRRRCGPWSGPRAR
jgi:hypothetical protein